MSENIIYYGVPGTGKSFTAKTISNEYPKFVTTFHPEYDYYDFVGSYRPINKIVNEDNVFMSLDSKDNLFREDYQLNKNTVLYQFSPQVFLKAYCKAWSLIGDDKSKVFLIVEEINRGNCAAIFGDIFQLLDRDAKGFSDYFCNVDYVVSNYLYESLHKTEYEIKIKDLYYLKNKEKLKEPYSIMMLPKNLYILATMNTSDQSLFPMDSAFKRRWEWQYIPINYDAPDVDKKIIEIGEYKYKWIDFLRKINEFIYRITEVEDKCIGQYFVKEDIISVNTFRNKVLYYLWSDILKNESMSIRMEVFPEKIINGEKMGISIDYNDLFDKNLGLQYINIIFNKLEVEAITSQEEDESQSIDQQSEQEDESQSIDQQSEQE